MTTTKHTAEPWRRGTAGNGHYVVAREDSPSGDYIANVGVSRGLTQADDNADRIVACVNACAGIDDPTALVPKMKELIERLDSARCNRPSVALDAFDRLLDEWLKVTS